MNYQELSNNIQRLRKEHGLTQDQLAEKLGVSSQAVSKWENGLSYPDISLLPELTNIFEVTMDDLFSQKKVEKVTYAPEKLRKSIDELFLRVRVLSSDGDKVNINLPFALVKALKSEQAVLNFGGNNLMEVLDLDVICDLAEKGAMGKLIEVESGDGDFVEVFVE